MINKLQLFYYKIKTGKIDKMKETNFYSKSKHFHKYDIPLFQPYLQQ